MINKKKKGHNELIRRESKKQLRQKEKQYYNWKKRITEEYRWKKERKRGEDEDYRMRRKASGGMNVFITGTYMCDTNYA